ncbi:MAG: hypothetical protein ACYDGY_04280 [Acidimicrobiales bacterium]
MYARVLFDERLPVVLAGLFDGGFRSWARVQGPVLTCSSGHRENEHRESGCRERDAREQGTCRGEALHP